MNFFFMHFSTCNFITSRITFETEHGHPFNYLIEKTKLMKINPLFLILFFLYSVKPAFAQAPAYSWAKGANGLHTDVGQSIATDASGNSFVTGLFFSDSITFGNTTLVNTETTGNSSDIFLVKYDASGNVVWAKKEGGNYNDNGYSVCTDGSGNVILAGQFLDISITIGSTILPNSSVFDIFLAKYDGAGNVLWAISPGGGEIITGFAATDLTGNVLLAGKFSGPTLTFGTTTLINSDTISSDLFIAKFDPAGNVLWAKNAGGNFADEAHAVAADVSGNIYLTGSFKDPSLILDSVMITNIDNTGNTSDIFLAKYDPAGNVMWAKSMGGIADDQGQCICVDPFNNVVISGNFMSSSVSFSSGALNNSATGSNDLFLAKYDPAGNCIWSEKAAGSSDDYVKGITNDATGNLFITGFYVSPSLTFGSSILTNTGVSTTFDLFISKYDGSGSLQWVKGAAGQFDEFAYDVAIDANGDLLVTGHFNSPFASFGSSNLPNTGAIDFFFVKLDNTTGVKINKKELSGFSIYPNPGNGIFTVASKENEYTITINTILGENIYKSEIKNQKQEIDLSKLAKGIYLVKIDDYNGTQATKIVVQ